MALSGASSCSDPGYDVVVRFETPALATSIDRVEVSLVRSCTTLTPGALPTDVSWQTLLRRGEATAPLTGTFAPGSYGLYARGWGAGCEVRAAGCKAHTLEGGGSGALDVTLAGIAASGTCACAVGETVCGMACVDLTRDRANCGMCARACGSGMSCFASVCIAGMDAGSPIDAGPGHDAGPGMDGTVPPPDAGAGDAGPAPDAGTDAGSDAGTDAGAERPCRVRRDCDDRNECTTDECDVTRVCTHMPDPDGSFCSDGRTCSTGDHCMAGACVGTVTVGSVCTDLNSCTTGDACRADATCAGTPAVGMTCTDGDQCTGPDRCNASGMCAGAIRTGSSCTDGVECTTGDTCDSGGSCSGSPASGIACTDDGNVCTSDQCSSGSCTHAAMLDGTACDDGVLCSLMHYCVAGSCICG